MKKETLSNLLKFGIAFFSALLGAISGASAAVVAMNATPMLIA